MSDDKSQADHTEAQADANVSRQEVLAATQTLRTPVEAKVAAYEKEIYVRFEIEAKADEHTPFSFPRHAWTTAKLAELELRIEALERGTVAT